MHTRRGQTGDEILSHENAGGSRADFWKWNPVVERYEFRGGPVDLEVITDLMPRVDFQRHVCRLAGLRTLPPDTRCCWAVEFVRTPTNSPAKVAGLGAARDEIRDPKTPEHVPAI